VELSNPILLLPEIILLAAACVCTLMGLSSKDSLRKATQSIAAIACLLAFLAAFYTADPAGAFPYAKYFNPNYLTKLTAAIGFLTILAARNMPAKSDPSVPDSNYRGEFFGMLLFSLCGVSMVGKVNDLVWLFIVLELVSIPTYIMVATGRSQIIAQEAGVKYFFLGALSAAIFLFGFSYIYGATGATRYEQIHEWFTHHDMTMLGLIGILMVIVGVSYKIAAVPLHFYAPDVYQGAATPVTAFLAYAPKAAGLIAIASTLALFDFNYTTSAGRTILSLLIAISVATMTVGNVMALLQRNIKRMFAYSSIAHSGYMLIGFIAMAPTASVAVAGRSMVTTHIGEDGVSATFFYLTSYALMNLGAFAVLIYLQGKADAAEDLDDVAGIAKANPVAALLMAICLLSLIGMPLTMGFLGKFYLIQLALVTNHPYLAVITVINAAIAAAYYLKIIAAMYLREPLYPFATRTALPIKIAALVCTIAVIAFFFTPGTILQANNTAVQRPAPQASLNHDAIPTAAR
jgi:NADH-quinone oxidoreductase subunit N